MKIRFIPCLLLLIPALTALVASAREDTAPANARPLAIVVVESTKNQAGGAISAFDRLDMAFQNVIKKRKWPVTLTVERFAANTPAHETELRVTNMSVRKDTPGELKFRGWMVLTTPDKKEDFGIITYSYYPRPAEQTDDVLDKVYRGAANEAADKMEPILFPKTADAK
jgi:hypothetical protein